jgi:hypothetical protein
VSLGDARKNAKEGRGEMANTNPKRERGSAGKLARTVASVVSCVAIPRSRALKLRYFDC